MPFGAEIGADETRFRLWAPGARHVALRLEGPGAERTIEMPRQPHGWYELHVPNADDGTRYRYRIDHRLEVPDPASRYQPDDVHHASAVIDPGAFHWTDAGWKGRPWEETVLYELHVGTFTPQGTFAAIKERLDYFVDLGITAIELMPIADFPGKRNWGYDGVLPFAPDGAYGRPEDLKDLIRNAHTKGLMVFLDVVYNHFGPDGNYLHCYAPDFFTDRHHTPWGSAINFDGKGSATVRGFFIHNALYWLEEYHFDGLRLDAVHAILDDSAPDILEELAQAAANGPGAERHVHLVLENDHNAARYLTRDQGGRPRFYTAQWNDDVHHALHVIGTGEGGGYYQDYVDNPIHHLARCLTEGFAYQGEPSPFRHGAPRGESTHGIPLAAFVSFLQNHDQVGNRAFGERITALAPEEAVRALTAILLLAPSPPLLFMGQEWGCPQPFLYFCDFEPDLAKAVTEGRWREFARFHEFRDPAARERIPDPNDPRTYQASILDWSNLELGPHLSWLRLYCELLEIRRREIVPRLARMEPGNAQAKLLGNRCLEVHWTLGDRSRLTLLANLGDSEINGLSAPAGRLLYATDDSVSTRLEHTTLAPWSVASFLNDNTATLR